MGDGIDLPSPCPLLPYAAQSDVRFWPKADIPSCTAHVRFRGSSGHADCSAKRRPMTQSG